MSIVPDGCLVVRGKTWVIGDDYLLRGKCTPISYRFGVYRFLFTKIYIAIKLLFNLIYLL